MGVLNLCGFETANFLETRDHDGSPSIQTSVVRTGTYALRCNPLNNNIVDVSFWGIPHANFNIPTGFNRFYFQWLTAPASNDEQLFSAWNNSNAIKFELRLNSAKQLVAYDSTGTLMATGTTALTSGTFYRIETQVGTGASANWAVEINGVSEISGTGNLTTTNNGWVSLGKRVNHNNNTVDFYYDDWIIRDDQFPGVGSCFILVPNADGSFTTWTIGAGSGSRWQQVTQIPQDADTTYLVSTGVIGNANTVKFPTTASQGITGTVNAVKAVHVVRGFNSPGVKGRIRSGSTNLDGPNFGPSGTYNTQDANSCIQLATTDPATGSPWTLSALDSVEIGLVENASGGSNLTRVTAEYLMVDTTASATPPVPNLSICGFEVGQTNSEVFNVANINGSVNNALPQVQSTIVRTGNFALEHNVAAGNRDGNVGIGGRLANGLPTSLTASTAGSQPTTFARFAFAWRTKPSANDEPLCGFVDVSSPRNIKLEIRLNSSGNLVAYDSTGTLLATGSTVLTLLTQYIIEVQCSTGSSSAWAIKLGLGTASSTTTEISGTGNLGANNVDAFVIGKFINRHSRAIDFFYDDVALSSQGFVGPGQGLLAIPSADGTYTSMSIGAGSGAKWQVVDDAPPLGDSSYLLSDGTVGDAYTAIINAERMRPTDTVNAVKQMAVVRQNGANPGNVKIRMRSGSTNADTTGFATGALYVTLEQLFTTDPNTSAAWAPANMTALESGAVENDTGTAFASRLTAAYIYVDFIPVTPPVVHPDSYHQIWNQPRRESLYRRDTGLFTPQILAPLGAVPFGWIPSLQERIRTVERRVPDGMQPIDAQQLTQHQNVFSAYDKWPEIVSRPNWPPRYMQVGEDVLYPVTTPEVVLVDKYIGWQDVPRREAFRFRDINVTVTDPNSPTRPIPIYDWITAIDRPPRPNLSDPRQSRSADILVLPIPVNFQFSEEWQIPKRLKELRYLYPSVFIDARIAVVPAAAIPGCMALGDQAVTVMTLSDGSAYIMTIGDQAVYLMSLKDIC